MKLCRGETMRRTKIEEQNEYLLIQQRRFRVAADVVTDAWMAFPEIHAVAVIGSVAKALWKEDFRISAISVVRASRFGMSAAISIWRSGSNRSNVFAKYTGRPIVP